jgi:type II restriction enzyme
MKWLKHYDALGLKNEDNVFNHLIETLRPGVADWHYFVDWNKAFTNTREIEVTLNLLNYLIGKDDFDKEFAYLVEKNPEVLKAIPVLMVRDGNKSTTYNVVTAYGGNLTNEAFNFVNPNPSPEDIKNYIRFIRNTGLIKIFEKDGVKNLVDYALGVEAGLSSNGRKNRSGTSMENVSEALIKATGYDYLAQATSTAIEQKFGVKIANGEGRKYDFAVMTPSGLVIIETNCYSGGGSKLDKTASDYRSLQDDLKGQATFVWFTDGYGWQKTKIPLRKTFDHNDHIFNIEMIKQGALAEVLSGQ